MGKKNFDKNKFKGGRNGGRSRNRNSQGFSKEPEGGLKDGYPINAGSNDVSWYSRYPALVSGSARFPFPYTPGRAVDFGTVKIGKETARTLKEGIPGVASIGWLPSVGFSTDNTSPINLAARELWAHVRSKFSSHLDADSPDMVIYLMALDSIYAYLGYLKSIYRSIDAYDPENHTVPDGLLVARGFTISQIESLRLNKARFWAGINSRILMARKFVCPDVMDIFRRHYWMSDNVYGDANSKKAQWYVFRMLGAYKYVETTVGTIVTGGLQMIKIGERLSSSTDPVTDMLAIADELITALSTDDTGYTISGYLMKAFEGAASFTISELPLTEPLEAVYNPEVLSQIENAFFVADTNRDSLSNLLGIDVTQEPSTNTIISTPKVRSGLGEGLETIKTWLSIRSDQPVEADVMIATRLKVAVRKNGDDYELICGSEIPWSIQYWIPETDPDFASSYGRWRYLSPSSVIKLELYKSTSTTAGDSELIANMVNAVLVKQQWDYAPLSLVITKTKDTTSMYKYDSTNFAGDIHNLTIITHTELEELHRTALCSELNSYAQ